jgi:hypothetical protein
MVEIFQREQRLRIISIFVDPTLSTLLSFFLLLLFLLGFDVLLAQRWSQSYIGSLLC